MRASKTSRIVATAGVLAALGVSLMASPAFAQDNPTSAQYDDQITQIIDQVGESAVSPESSSGTPVATVTAVPSANSGGGLDSEIIGGLPFTGLDVISLLAVAVALMSFGTVLRRLSAPRDGAH